MLSNISFFLSKFVCPSSIEFFLNQTKFRCSWSRLKMHMQNIDKRDSCVRLFWLLSCMRYPTFRTSRNIILVQCPTFSVSARARSTFFEVGKNLKLDLVFEHMNLSYLGPEGDGSLLWVLLDHSPPRRYMVHCPTPSLLYREKRSDGSLCASVTKQLTFLENFCSLAFDCHHIICEEYTMILPYLKMQR
jgi:hypothetical protein